MPDAVATQLQGQILDGQLEAGLDLPGERALAESLGVSRPTVREALRQLQQRGLVEIRQGGATTVRDFRRTAGLDLLPQLLRRTGRLNVALVADIMRARSAIGPQVARAAAEEVAEEVAGKGPGGADAVLQAAAVVRSADGAVAQQRAALSFWDAVVDLTGSMVYRLLFNGLRRAYEPTIDALAGVMAVEVGEAERYRSLAQAIAAADPDGAAAAAEVLLAAGRAAVQSVIDQLAETPRTADRSTP
ncbi:GntR family transcriptional regulator [soil metagenome]